METKIDHNLNIDHFIIDLWEPSKPAIREYEKTRIPPPREARVEILTEKEIVCWGICSLTSASFTEWNEHPKREGILFTSSNVVELKSIKVNQHFR